MSSDYPEDMRMADEFMKTIFLLRLVSKKLFFYHFNAALTDAIILQAYAPNTHTPYFPTRKNS